jgi:oligosaccharide repeat unit polymerase
MRRSITPNKLAMNNQQVLGVSYTPTMVILCGLALTAAVLFFDNAEDIFAAAAVGVGLSIGIATAIEARAGVRSLIRVDILMLWSLYALTFLEFLFPQPGVGAELSASAAVMGTYAALLGFAGLAVGRHLIPRRGDSWKTLSFTPGLIFALFLVTSALGYLYILLAVNFDPFEMLRQMALPRFSQSWARGRYGDILSLLGELGLLINLLPPLAGLIFAQRNQYSFLQKVTVAIVLAITCFAAIASGTRSAIAGYVFAFAGAYILMKPGIKLRQVILVGTPVVLVLLAVTALMLEFRTEGIGSIFSRERNYHYDTLTIDHNMVNLTKLTQVFPDSSDFLGFEIPFQALIRPIPRALWPGKPEGLSTTIESALGANDQSTTFSCTFVGEAYMAGGFLAVLLMGLFFGGAAELWNRVGRNTNSSFAQVLYASGFFCAALAMRSMLSMVPFMLPTLALWLFGKGWLRPAAQRRHPSIVRSDKH